MLLETLMAWLEETGATISKKGDTKPQETVHSSTTSASKNSTFAIVPESFTILPQQISGETLPKISPWRIFEDRRDAKGGGT